jgi:serine phosphatase RsbU (regulator of sigma subunit)
MRGMGSEVRVIRPAAIAATAGLAAFLLGTAVESTVIRAVHGNRSELEWLSDVVVSSGVVAITYLWLHLKASRSQLLALEREQIAVDEQLRLAAKIQSDLLPPVPRNPPGYAWGARMVSAGRIGGDLYDFFEPGDGTVLALLADVSGKGIPAALILSSLKVLFRTVARATAAPEAIAERISAALHEEHGGLPYATAIVARVLPAEGKVAYVNAGHPAGFLVRDGKASPVFDSGGPPLGLLAGNRYEARVVDVAPGDVALFVTDGVTEAFESGPVTLEQALRAATGGLSDRPVGELCDSLLRSAAEGGGPPGAPGWQDDRTVVAFAAGTREA